MDKVTLIKAISFNFEVSWKTAGVVVAVAAIAIRDMSIGVAQHRIKQVSAIISYEPYRHISFMYKSSATPRF